jgi:hypothetical protein
VVQVVECPKFKPQFHQKLKETERERKRERERERENPPELSSQEELNECYL